MMEVELTPLNLPYVTDTIVLLTELHGQLTEKEKKIESLFLYMLLQKYVSLFVCFESHEQFFSYLVTITITGDRAANLDLCLVLTAFSMRVLLRNTYCGTPVFKVISERSVILTSEYRALDEGAIITYVNTQNKQTKRCKVWHDKDSSFRLFNKIAHKFS
jgi:hypothetical protein